MKWTRPVLLTALIFSGGLTAASPGALCARFEREELLIEGELQKGEADRLALFIALDLADGSGSQEAPESRYRGAKSLRLPVAAERIYCTYLTGNRAPAKTWQEWKAERWSGPMDVKPEFTAELSGSSLQVRIRLASLPHGVKHFQLVAWTEPFGGNDPRGDKEVRFNRYSVDLESRAILTEAP